MPIGIMVWHRWGAVNNRCGRARKQESAPGEWRRRGSGAHLLAAPNKSNQGALPERGALQSQERELCICCFSTTGLSHKRDIGSFTLKERVTMRYGGLYCPRRKIWPLRFTQPSALWRQLETHSLQGLTRPGKSGQPRWVAYFQVMEYAWKMSMIPCFAVVCGLHVGNTLLSGLRV